MKRLIAIFAALGLVACAHSPAAAQHQPTASAERLIADVTALSADAMQGRGFGQPGGQMARDYIIAGFEAAGIEPLNGDWLLPFTAPAGARNPIAINGVNVAAAIPGTEAPDQWIVVTAHYDHVGVQGGQIYNGADDNASGTAALLELARMLRDHPPRHSVLLLALDGEEAGLLGARAFVANSPIPLENMVVNINLDMIARGDNGILWVVGTRQYPAIRPVVDALAEQPGIERRYGFDDPAAPRSESWVNASDQAAFHARGVPFVFFSVEEHGDYHQPTDDADLIDADWYRGAVQTSWDALHAIDHMDQPNFRPAPASAGGPKR